MLPSIRSLVATIAIVLALSTMQAGAQSSNDGASTNASAIVARMRAARAENAKHSIDANLYSTTILNVLDGQSKINLIKPQTIITEMAGWHHSDAVVGTRVHISMARGTPLEGLSRGPLENILTLAEIVSIDDDEIVLLNTAIASPLADNADEHYTYSVEGRQQRNGIDVDVVRVTPRSNVRPLFEGRLYTAREKQAGRLHADRGVVAGTLLGMDLTPSTTTAIPFIDS